MKCKGYSEQVPYISKFIYLWKCRKNVLHIFDPIFKQNYWVFDNKWKQKEVIDYLRTYNKNIEDGNSCVGKFWGIENCETEKRPLSMGVIWFTNTPTLIHECVHATNWLIDNHSLKPDDELQSYYTEWLYRVISMDYKL